MKLWRPVAETVWQGRDDSAEASPREQRQQQLVGRQPADEARDALNAMQGLNAIRAGPAPRRPLIFCAKRWRIWQAIRDTNGWRIWARCTLKAMSLNPRSGR